jgi:hypothetical protein
MTGAPEKMTPQNESKMKADIPQRYTDDKFFLDNLADIHVYIG